MASKFRARDPDPDERGAGGKMLRPRHRHRGGEAVSPYLRPAGEATAPSSSFAVVAEARERRGWLSGLMSGTGRLISAVFRSGNGSSSCSCSDDSDYSGDSDGGDSEGASLRDDEKKDQPGMHLELVEDQAVDCQPLACMSRSKLVIEQLLQQDTYTRDECSRLMKIIQSRVVDSPTSESGRSGLPLEFLSRTPSSNIASPRPLVLGLNNELLGRSPVLDGYLNTIYSSPYTERAHTPDFCDKAVLEAKKWVEEKRSLASPKVDQNCEPCVLNTDMYSYESESDRGSPVDLAKSYMESLPPWQSPVARTAGFRSPTIAAHSEKYKSPFGPAHSSLRATKRSLVAVGSWDTFDATRSVCQKTTEDIPVSPVFGESDTSNRMLNHAHIQTSSVPDKKVPEVLSADQDACILPTSTSNATTTLPAEFTTKYWSSGSENGHNPLKNNGFCKEAGNSDHENAVNALEHNLNEYVRHGNSTRNLDSESGLQVQSLDPWHDILLIEKNQVKDLDGSPIVKEQLVTITHEAAVNSSLTNNDLIEDFVHAEPIAVVPEKNNPAISSAPDEAVDISGHGASSPQRGSELEKLGRDNSSLQPDSFSVPEEEKEALDQSTSLLNMDLNSTTTSNGAVGGDNFPVNSCKPSSSTSANATGVLDSSAHGGTTLKDKQMLQEHPSSPGRGRGKKSAARPLRARGRGRGRGRGSGR